MTRNWEDLGISWSLETVSERISSNASDKRTLGECPILQVSDLDKFRTAVGDEVILGILDGTSIRVTCQDVGRRGLKANPKASVDAMKEDCWNRVRGIRSARRAAVVKTVEVKVYALPNGETYSGSNVQEYQAQYMAALVDAGVPAETARAIALTQTL